MDEEAEVLQPSKTYRVFNGRVMGMIDDLEAMAQVISKILATQRFSWDIYSDNYGTEFEHLLGADFAFVLAEIERILSEALLVDERIQAVSEFETEKASSDALLVSFVVTTIFGNIPVQKVVEL